MKEKYVQLPPLPLDMSLESIEIIWIYAKLPQQEKKMFQEFIREMLDDDKKEICQTQKDIQINFTDAETNPDIAEFISLLQKMIGILIMQACEMAAIVYKNYCMDGKSIEKISEMINVSKDTVQLISQYYDRKE